MTPFEMFIKRVSTWSRQLSARERSGLFLALVCMALVAVYSGVKAFRSKLDDQERLVQSRLSQLEQLPKALNRYKRFDTRLKKLQSTFAQSELTFEQAFNELDKIVQTSVGKVEYDPRKGAVTPLGLEYQKQEFTLKLRGISIEQVVKLLYQLEHGDRPLFLGKVDILRAPSDGTFSATLEIFSIRKS